MNVIFVTFSKKENSTAQPNVAGITPVSMQLKAPCTERSPVLECATYYAGNYCYIPTWSRYYFIRNKTYINGAWDYELECDYLATWKTQIGSSSFYVTRSASARNQKIVDGLYPLNGEYTVAGSSDNQALGLSFNSGVIVLGVLGNNSTGQTLYEIDANDFGSVLSSLFTTADGLTWTDIPQGAKNSIMNPTQYITSCRWYPFSFTSNHGLSGFKAGLWDCSVSCAKVNTPMPGSAVFSLMMSVPSHTQASTRGLYTNLKPFTTLYMELPGLGLFELDESLLFHYPKFRIRLMLDPYNGVGTWDGWGCDSDQTARCMVFKKDSQIGIDIPLSSNDKAFGSFASGVLGAIGTVAMSLVNPLAEGASALAKGIAVGSKATDSLMKGMEGATSGIQSTNYTRGTLMEMMDFKTRMFAVFREQCEVDVVNKGRPLCEMKTLSTLSGYMEVMSASVSIPASDDEMSVVNTMLENGFYYE